MDFILSSDVTCPCSNVYEQSNRCDNLPCDWDTQCQAGICALNSCGDFNHSCKETTWTYNRCDGINCDYNVQCHSNYCRDGGGGKGVCEGSWGEDYYYPDPCGSDSGGGGSDTYNPDD